LLLYIYLQYTLDDCDLMYIDVILVSNAVFFS
jgi:hypothetical protein